MLSSNGTRYTPQGRPHCSMQTAAAARSSAAVRSAMSRAAARAPAPPARRAAVRVLACQGNSGADAATRARALSLGRDFVAAWIAGGQAGASEGVMARMERLVDDDVLIRTAHPIANVESKGLDALRRKLDADHDHVSAMAPRRDIMWAAAEDASSVFVLLEVEPTRAERAAHAGHTAYGIVKLSVEVGGEARRVTVINERCQLGPADACLLAMVGPNAGAATMDGVETDLEVAGTWHFPTTHVTYEGADAEGRLNKTAAKDSIQRWCDARCTGNDENIFRGAVDEGVFHMWDGYGVLPTVQGPWAKTFDGSSSGSSGSSGVSSGSGDGSGRSGSGGGGGGGGRTSCVLVADEVLKLIGRAKEQYHISCTLIDSAICSHNNVGFSHWRSSIRSKEAEGSGFVMQDAQECIMEAMSLHIFNDDGRMVDLWMLRDPTVAEREVIGLSCGLRG
ncbi:hypothetical protein FOA52_016269 [Chlamydomonas sp. UWO 241]|nr:hypothetical protein FOA52_016269 [Chlamydomonas sp. UWO 241]